MNAKGRESKQRTGVIGTPFALIRVHSRFHPHFHP
jgi:hypothetical protein